MVTVNSTFNNFSEVPILMDLLGQFSNDYEYTTKGIFRTYIPQMYYNLIILMIIY